MIYDVVKGDCYHGGGAFQFVETISPPPFKAKPLGDSSVAGIVACLETNEWGWLIWSRAVLGVRVYGSAAISLPRFCQGVC